MAELPGIIQAPPPVLKDIGKPLRSRDIGKTIAIPNIKNIGVHPIRSTIATQSDSAQHMMYLRIATPFDHPDERPYSIVSVGTDHIKEVQRVRMERQHPQYKYVSNSYFYSVFSSITIVLLLYILMCTISYYTVCCSIFCLFLYYHAHH